MCFGSVNSCHCLMLLSNRWKGVSYSFLVGLGQVMLTRRTSYNRGESLVYKGLMMLVHILNDSFHCHSTCVWEIYTEVLYSVLYYRVYVYVSHDKHVTHYLWLVVLCHHTAQMASGPTAPLVKQPCWRACSICAWSCSNSILHWRVCHSASLTCGRYECVQIHFALTLS